jgi:hypothetical protein
MECFANLQRKMEEWIRFRTAVGLGFRGKGSTSSASASQRKQEELLAVSASSSGSGSSSSSVPSSSLPSASVVTPGSSSTSSSAPVSSTTPSVSSSSASSYSSSSHRSLRGVDHEEELRTFIGILEEISRAVPYPLATKTHYRHNKIRNALTSFSPASPAIAQVEFLILPHFLPSFLSYILSSHSICSTLFFSKVSQPPVKPMQKTKQALHQQLLRQCFLNLQFILLISLTQLTFLFLLLTKEATLLPLPLLTLLIHKLEFQQPCTHTQLLVCQDILE